MTLPPALGPDLVGPIDVEILFIDPGDLRLEGLVADFADARWCR